MLDVVGKETNQQAKAKRFMQVDWHRTSIRMPRLMTIARGFSVSEFKGVANSPWIYGVDLLA